MRAFVIDGPRSGRVRDVPEPKATGAEVVIDVETVGLCGTDVELFAGTMPYFRQGVATYPLRPGHEWAGTVVEIGPDVIAVNPGDRVTGDTFVGCGACDRCDAGRHHLCEQHLEIGVRDGRPGALAERVVIPEVALHKIPPQMTAAAAALVEPGACALRAVEAAGIRDGVPTLVWGTGTLGLLAAQFARAQGAQVCVLGVIPGQRDLATRLGFTDVVAPDELGARHFDAVIEATGAPSVPQEALSHVTPGGRLALLGVTTELAALDAGKIVLDDITVIGVLGGSACIDKAIDLLAGSNVDVEPMIAATVGLDDVAALLQAGCRLEGNFAPKIHVQPSHV